MSVTTPGKYGKGTDFEMIVSSTGKSLTNVKNVHNKCESVHRIKSALTFLVRRQKVQLVCCLFKVFEFYLFKITMNITSSIGFLLF